VVQSRPEKVSQAAISKGLRLFFVLFRPDRYIYSQIFQLYVPLLYTPDITKERITWRESLPLSATEVRAARPAEKEYTPYRTVAACERGKVLVAYYEQVAVNPDSGTVYQYQEGIWQHQPDTLLKRTLAAIFEAHETPYNPKGIEAAIESMRIMDPVLPTSGRAQVAFVNGVYDLNAGQFQPHSPDNGLLHHNGIIWTEATPGESLKDHAPHFTAG